MYYSVFLTGYGRAAAVFNGSGIRRFYLPAEENGKIVNLLRRDYPGIEERVTEEARDTGKRIAGYFRGEDTRLNDMAVDFSDYSDFTKKILRAACSVPYGEVRTYKWIAEKAGGGDKARAAGNALNKNKLPIIVPCHRIVKSGGEPGGFSSGIGWKIKLLRIEKSIIQRR